jgi:predicted ATPase
MELIAHGAVDSDLNSWQNYILAVICYIRRIGSGRARERITLQISRLHPGEQKSWRLSGNFRAQGAVAALLNSAVMADSSTSRKVIKFGRFTIHPQRRELNAGTERIELGGRLYDLLLTLLEARGAVVSKIDLIKRVWPGRVMEDNNLAVAISTLRRAMGEDGDTIRTVSGRGYQLLCELREVDEQPASRSSTQTNLPAATSELVGREVATRNISDLVREHRMLTLTGAGGIGKTRLAIEVARGLVPEFPDGVWMVDLAPMTDGRLVAARVAIALGLKASDATPEALPEVLKHRRLLVLLDNCEHLVDAAAMVATQLVRASSSVFVLCTGREPLRAESEWVYQVPPLDVPVAESCTEQELMQSGAARLFVSRTRAAQPSFRVDPTTLARIASVCRRLDGMPLALELAAARAATLGIQGVASRLNDRFRLLTGGSRTALPRHQTLHATFDWSYEMLPEDERVAFCRLAIFAAEFTLEAATSVVNGSEEESEDLARRLALLVEKSLISVNFSSDPVRYRMLETTRAYAMDNLVKRGELQRYARLHALYLLSTFRSAWSEWVARPVDPWDSEHDRLIDDARAALDWAFSLTGDATLGAELTIYLAPLWIRPTLPTEWAARNQQALKAVTSRPTSDSRLEMKLNAALGVALMDSGNIGPESEAANERALVLAERLKDTEYQLIPLYTLFSSSTAPYSCFGRALSIAIRFSEVAEIHGDSSVTQLGQVLLAWATLPLGQLDKSVMHIAAANSGPIPTARRLSLMTYQCDTLGIHAITLWLRGLPDQSTRMMKESAKKTLDLGHSATLCLNFAVCLIPAAMLIGDLTTAGEYAALLATHQKKTQYLRVNSISAIDAALRIRRGEFAGDLPVFRLSLDDRSADTTIFSDGIFRTLLAAALGETGEIRQALELINQAIQDTDRTEIRWCLAEYWRVKGDLLMLKADTNSMSEAQSCYLMALSIARQQGALAWELRTITSFARLLELQGDSERAEGELRAVYDRLTEGFETADVVKARALLHALSTGIHS